jgi:hypothetical protein
VSERRRFRVHFVDPEQRLYVYVASAGLFVVASYARDLLRTERGGDWIIIDGETGRCVSDTRPRVVPAGDDDAERERPCHAPLDSPRVAVDPDGRGEPTTRSEPAARPEGHHGSRGAAGRRHQPTRRRARAPLEID